jgi:Protein of unknown function (DUF3040)
MNRDTGGHRAVGHTLPARTRELAMLDAGDQERLREIEAHLLAEDPHFVAVMRGEYDESHHNAMVLGGLWIIWAVTLVGIATVGWPVLVVNGFALLALGVVTIRVLRRRRLRAFVVG